MADLKTRLKLVILKQNHENRMFLYHENPITHPDYYFRDFPPKCKRRLK